MARLRGLALPPRQGPSLCTSPKKNENACRLARLHEHHDNDEREMLTKQQMKREAVGRGEFSVGRIFGAATPPGRGRIFGAATPPGALVHVKKVTVTFFLRPTP